MFTYPKIYKLKYFCEMLNRTNSFEELASIQIELLGQSSIIFDARPAKY